MLYANPFLNVVSRILAIMICTSGLMVASQAHADDYDEALSGDLSNDRLKPSVLNLSYGPLGSNGLRGNNIVSGKLGRSSSGIDRDYLHIIVPVGFALSELRVGNATTVGGSGSFIGIASGSFMPVSPSAINATGLLGYHVYTAADKTQDILDDMASSSNGASGFSTPLAAGDYTLWIQELATGSFNYRFNLILTEVPEPHTWVLLLAGQVLASLSLACRRNKQANAADTSTRDSSTTAIAHLSQSLPIRLGAVQTHW
jgi:hypothetical protein